MNLSAQTVSVIVTKCNEAGTSAYEHISVDKYASVPAAMAATERLRRKGVCVIVRPNYNEVRTTIHGHVRYFREWRSFNGAPFKECSWDV